MNFVILDLEWNGTYSRRLKGFMNEIIEFGAVKVDECLHVLDTFDALVRPQVGKKISGKIKTLTNITNEELAVILARAIEKLELKTSKINSVDKGDYKFLADWNRDGIIKMLELDLMDFTFENNQVVVKEISRAEFANIIYKLINSLN